MICEITKNSELVSVQDGINKRFFIAVEELVNSGAVKSLSEFCNSYGLNRVKYWEMSLRYGVKGSFGVFSRYKAVEATALYILVSAFHFSAEWLLTGKGNNK